MFLKLFHTHIEIYKQLCLIKSRKRRCRSQWPRGLRRTSTTARLLGLNDIDIYRHTKNPEMVTTFGYRTCHKSIYEGSM